MLTLAASASGAQFLFLATANRRCSSPSHYGPQLAARYQYPLERQWLSLVRTEDLTVQERARWDPGAP